jgi:hypothetical protein
MELYMRPTDNWDIFVNVAKVDAIRQNLAGSMSAWLESRWEAYQGPTGDLRWWNGTPQDTETGRARFSAHAYNDYVLARAEEGNTVAELRPWRFNIITNYRFTEGFLERLLRWRWLSLAGQETSSATA